MTEASAPSSRSTVGDIDKQQMHVRVKNGDVYHSQSRPVSATLTSVCLAKR